MPSAADDAVLIADRFPSDEPPTLPLRAHSGAAIKSKVIRAISDQIQAEKACFGELDNLNRILQSLLRRRQREELQEKSG